MKIVKNPNAKAAFPEIRGTLAAMKYPCFGEIKYDGEACFVHYVRDAKNKIATTNKYGTMRYDWIKLNRIAQILEENNIKQALMQAELFYGDGTSGRLYDLLSHKDDDGLNVIIFDINYLQTETGNCTAEMKGETTPLIERKEILAELFCKEPVFLLSPKLISSRKEAEAYFDTITAIGFEGVVLKQMDGFATQGPCPWVKMKKKDQNVFEVRHIDPVKERITIASITHQNGCTKVTDVGVKCMDKCKSGLEIGDKVIIEHQGVLSSGSLRHPVFIMKEGEQ